MQSGQAPASSTYSMSLLCAAKTEHKENLT